MGRKISVSVGDEYANGMLEVIKVHPSNKTGVHSKFTVKCHFCGSDKKMTLPNLKKSNSCGCQKHNINTWKHVGAYTKSWQLPSGVSARNNLEYQYKRSAKKRNLSYTLTTEQFDSIVTGLCHYCGDSLTAVVKGQGKTSGDFLYTGIDRVDNSKGYTKKNVVSCCWNCNNMKGKMTENEFITHVKKIVEKLVINDD